MKNFFHKFTKHLPHYLSLIGILSATLFGFMFFSYDKVFQTAVVISGSAAFVAWGIIYHFIHEDFHLKILLEYLATTALGLAILLNLIWS